MVAHIVTQWRERLYDLSWLMRRVNEAVARMANAEDNVKGHFGEGHFESQALPDKTAFLSCTAHVDLIQPLLVLKWT